MTSSRLDILEGCANAVCSGEFDAAIILLARFFECSPGWMHPRDTEGKEREAWEAIVNGVNFWRKRYIHYLDMSDRMSPEFQANWETKTRDLIRLYEILFVEEKGAKLGSN